MVKNDEKKLRMFASAVELLASCVVVLLQVCGNTTLAGREFVATNQRVV